MTFARCLFLLLVFIPCCVPRVAWEKRKDAMGTEQVVPICPSCQHVVNFRVIQCQNPDCRTLLRWRDKTIYAEKLYGEDGLAAPEGKPPFSKQEENPSQKSNKSEKTSAPEYEDDFFQDDAKKPAKKTEKSKDNDKPEQPEDDFFEGEE